MTAKGALDTHLTWQLSLATKKELASVGPKEMVKGLMSN
jgi:hypothetical protein